MEQTNIESGRIRKVRWTGTPLNIEDAPREKRTEPASPSNEGCVAAGPGVEGEVKPEESTLQVIALGSSSNGIQRKSSSSHNKISPTREHG